MKFKFLLIGLLVVFSSVGSYAGGDKLGFSLESVKLKKNTWGGGNANLKIYLIYENSSGEASKLRVVENKDSALGETIALDTNGGLFLPIESSSIDVAVIVLHEDEDAMLASLVYRVIENISRRKTVKMIGELTKRNWYTLIAKTAVDMSLGFGVDKIIEYLEKNEIYKTTITISKGSNNWNYSNKTKGNSSIELVYETRFSGKNSSSSSTQSNSSTKWITPDDSVCRSNGGAISYGVCGSNWLNAKDICRASGGSLPSITELKNVVIECGGNLNKVDDNKANSSYQSCYRDQGFSSSNYYWSEDIWSLFFFAGGGNERDKRYEDFVRCVK